jgi:CHAT domain-containing protein
MNLVEWYERCYEASGKKDKEALRHMLCYRANSDDMPFIDPYYWAGFVLTGIGM